MAKGSVAAKAAAAKPAVAADPAVKVAKKRVHKKSKNTQENRILNPDTTGERGVVYLASIPDEMYEPQIREFFSQFGDITRMRLARSKRTGRPKHFGFIEFELKEIAEIAAKAMDKYFFQGTPMKAKLMDEVHPETFRNAHKMHFDIQRKRLRTEIARANTREIRPDGSIEKTQGALEKSTRKADKQRAKLAKLGIDFAIESFEKLNLPVRIAEPKKKEQPQKRKRAAEDSEAVEAKKKKKKAAVTPKAAVVMKAAVTPKKAAVTPKAAVVTPKAEKADAKPQRPTKKAMLAEEAARFAAKFPAKKTVAEKAPAKKTKVAAAKEAKKQKKKA